jgi:hypothetical protein
VKFHYLYSAFRLFKSHYINPLLLHNKRKIFCIGHNKTGTTSLKKAFADLGFIVGDQSRAERLLPNYDNNDFKKIISYCKTAQVFQDFPFSYPNTYKKVDQAFPDAKFILTIRDNPEVWYHSLINHHSKVFGHGMLPNAEDLKQASYVWPGWIWESNRLIYNSPEEDPYNKECLINFYVKYNAEIIKYFKNRPDDLLILNLNDANSYKKFIDFLDVKSHYTSFPWQNKTKDKKIKH